MHSRAFKAWAQGFEVTCFEVWHHSVGREKGKLRVPGKAVSSAAHGRKRLLAK